MTQILVVDEDTDLQRLLRIKLGNAGYTVLRARDGAEALSVVSEQRPEVVITELVLPDHGGTEVLAQLALADPAPLVLVLSRLNSDETIAAALAAGAADYVAKPFSPETLLERLRVNLVRAGLAVPAPKEQ